MKALVVGATGFVGMNVVRALSFAGHDVIGTRRQHGNTLFARRLGVPLVVAELDQPERLSDAMRGRDVVFMCAAHYPRYSLEREREVALARARVRAVLEAARATGVRRLVLTSSVATVGPPRAGQKLSDESNPIDPRAQSCVYHSVKLAIEEEALSERGSLEVVVLCPSAIFGELDVKAGTGSLLVAVGNQKLRFYISGRINLVDADDLGRAHVAAAERGRAGERYIIGGHNLTVSALIERCAAILGVPLKAIRLPIPCAALASTLAEIRAQKRRGRRPFLSRELVDVVRFGQWVSSAKAHRELGLGAPTPLDETLAKACSWYVRHRYVRLEQGGHGANHGSTNPGSDRGDHSAYSP